MLPLLLFVVSIFPSQQAATTCADTGAATATGQTQSVRGPGGVSAVLKVSSADDHSKNSHECMADFQLLIGPPGGGEPIVVDFLSSDGDWGREISLRLDGFSKDGKHIFGVLSEGGKWPSAMLFDYDTVTKGSAQIIDLTKLFKGVFPVACRPTLHVAGTTAAGGIVVEQVSSGSCGAASQWEISPAAGKPRALQSGAKILGLYQAAADPL